MTLVMSRSIRTGKATRDREDHASQIGADHAPQSGSMETALPKWAAIAAGAIRKGSVSGDGWASMWRPSRSSQEAGSSVRPAEEPARLDSGDLLGDVEQGVEVASISKEDPRR